MARLFKQFTHQQETMLVFLLALAAVLLYSWWGSGILQAHKGNLTDFSPSTKVAEAVR